MPKIIRLILTLSCVLLLNACADLGYYLHSVNGHFDIIKQRQDIEDILRDERASEALKQRLQLVQRIRRFAFDELQLPESGSYSDFVDLKRNYVLKNLFAAEEFSINAKKWCYPIVGCAGYRGFYEQQRLDDFVADLKRDEYDIYIAHVAAYSTLGWFDDPVLNTFIHWPDYRLAGLIFHELAHQQLYIDGDTRFNESFATAVQQGGVEKWMLAEGSDESLQRYRQRLRNRQQVFDLIRQARNDLQQLYQRKMGVEEKRALKSQYLARLKQQYQTLPREYDESDGFERWFAGELNNAKLVSVSTYNDWVTFFVQLLSQSDGDFAAFYQQVAELSELPHEKRQQCFNEWLKGPKQLIDERFCGD